MIRCALLDEKNDLRVVNPVLATYVGLNESIFLRQLHFILSDNDSVGKWADGRKWYRDKPVDWVGKYFPFWDEGVVKRTIANLRADGLLDARHDLNSNRKNTALWYSINYPAMERLDGPVDRIAAKKAKRKAAKEAHQKASDSDSEYTKEQNVLSLNKEVQNVPATRVQNVPTPKDSLPKDSQKNKSKDLGEKSPKQKKPEYLLPQTEAQTWFIDTWNEKRRGIGYSQKSHFDNPTQQGKVDREYPRLGKIEALKCVDYWFTDHNCGFGELINKLEKWSTNGRQRQGNAQKGKRGTSAKAKRARDQKRQTRADQQVNIINI